MTGNSMAKTINIVICDDHAIVRMGLKFLIAQTPGMQVVGEAADGEEAVALAGKLKPDVILMNLVMQRKDGVIAIREIKEQNPDVRILVLTGFSDRQKVFSAIEAGANGYLLNDSSAEELLQAIKDVHQGRSCLSPVIARKEMQELPQASGLQPADESLSAREVEVLQYVAAGLSNKEIARTLKIKEGTVRIHVGNILNKLQLSNRTQAALYALRKGLAHL